MSTSVEPAPGPWLALFERFPFPAVVVERGTTRLLRANHAATELLGLDRYLIGTETGPCLADFVTRPLAELDDDLRIAAGGGDLPLVFRASPGGDEPNRHGCQVVPIGLEPGPIDRWMVTFGCNLARLNRFSTLSRELREAKEEAAVQRQLRDRTQTDLRALERFAQAMAHDLKGPLRHIGTLLPAIEESLGAELAPESRRLMELAQLSAKRGRELVDALLTHATAVSGDIVYQSVDLDRVVQGTIAEHRWALDGLPNRISVVGPLGVVDADRSLLRVLVANLISNAIKYRSPDRDLEIEITGRPDDAATLLEISDNGIGFAPEDAARIFEPFVRLESSVNGHGIGLATCSTICHRHGWSIDASGQRDMGARFRVRLA